MCICKYIYNVLSILGKYINYHYIPNCLGMASKVMVISVLYMVVTIIRWYIFFIVRKGCVVFNAEILKDCTACNDIRCMVKPVSLCLELLNTRKPLLSWPSGTLSMLLIFLWGCCRLLPQVHWLALLQVSSAMVVMDTQIHFIKKMMSSVHVKDKKLSFLPCV